MAEIVEITYAGMAERLGKEKDFVQGVCHRYTERAPKPVRTEGQHKFFDQAEMDKFFAWYADTVAESGTAKRSPRSPLEVAQADLIRLETRHKRHSDSIERLLRKVRVAEKERDTAAALLADKRKTVTKLKQIQQKKEQLERERAAQQQADAE